MSSSSQLTRNCLTFEERPGTPEHLKKYRKSSYLEPGKRYQHPGVHDDYPSLNLESKIFGAVDPLTRDGASDLIHLPTPSEAKKLDQYKKELTYKSTFREPLGKIFFYYIFPLLSILIFFSKSSYRQNSPTSRSFPTK